jgi:predicted amidohydrolase YtcJ
MLVKAKHFLFFIIFLVIFAAMCCQPKITKEKADIVLINGNIITLNRDLPRAEAIAIKGNKIFAVGKRAEIESLIGEQTKVVELDGKLVIPGFIDAHVHPFGAGHALTVIDLKGLRKEDILHKVAKKAKEIKDGDWIEGAGWDQGFWEKKTFPTRYELDVIAPNNPVMLTRIDGHSAWYNSMALRKYNITKDTENPEGGRIIRDAQGEPTGILIDAAMNLIPGDAYQGDRRAKESYIKLAMDQYKSWGVTGIHDAGADKQSLEVYKKLIKEGGLTVRVYAMVYADSDAFPECLSRGPEIGLGDNFLTIRSIKIIFDGALGSRGALLFEPYSDSPDTTGLQLIKENKAYSIIKKSLEKGFQVCIHAIGDKANHMVLGLYQKALKENPVKDHRLRIEHVSIIQDQDVLNMKQMNVIASMQPIFIGEYGRWAEDRLGPQRVKNVLVFRRLLDAGVKIAAGTDTPASDSGNPIINFYAAIARKSPFGVSEEWYGNEKVTREEALRMMTVDAAYAAFEENSKGSIENGKLADIIVLSHNIMEIEEEKILNTKVVMTILNGRIIYSK